MKKFICLLVFTMSLIVLNKSVFAGEMLSGNLNTSSVNVLVNGQAVLFPDAQPFIDENGRTLVPIRAIAEALGVEVGWDDANKAVSLTGDSTVSFVIGEKKALVNGQAETMDTAAVIVESRTFVPLRFASEYMGAAVEWYGETKTANIWMKEKEEGDLSEPLDPDKEAEKRAKIIESLPQYMGKKGADTIYTYDEITEEEAKRRAKVIEELKEYPFHLKSNPTSSLTYEEHVDKYGEQLPKDYAQIVTAFMELGNNVDYRTITENFIEEYRYFFKPGRGHKWYFWVEDKWYNTDQRIQKRYDEIREHEIIQKARFITDETLFRVATCETRVRGRFEVCFESASPEYLEDYEKSMIIWTGESEAHKNTSRALNIGKWYYCDVEIDLGYLASRDHTVWEHTKYNFCNIIYISEFKPLED